MNYFIMVFDREPEKSYRDFHKEFVAHEKILHWWHYLKDCYLLVTDLDASDLSKHARQLFEKYNLPTRHLVLEANFAFRSGFLPKRAWTWLDQKGEEQWKELNPDED